MTLVLWHRFDPNLPIFQFQESHAWAPSLGMTYHVGHRRARPADAGALRDRRADVPRRLMGKSAPGRCLLRAGAFAGSRPLRHLHRAELRPLVSLLGAEPDPRLLPDAAVGRPATRARRDPVLPLHHGRQRGAAARLPGHLSRHAATSTSSNSPASPRAASSARRGRKLHGTASRQQHLAMFLFCGGLPRLRRQRRRSFPSTPGCPPPTPKLPPRPPCCLPARCRRWASTASCASCCPSSRQQMQRALTPLLWLAVATIVLLRIRRLGAERPQAHLRLLLDQSPRLLRARHLRRREDSPARTPAWRTKRPPRSTASCCRSSATASPRRPSSGSSPCSSSAAAACAA